VIVFPNERLMNTMIAISVANQTTTAPNPRYRLTFKSNGTNGLTSNKCHAIIETNQTRQMIDHCLACFTIVAFAVSISSRDRYAAEG